jgi:hypothetical protein
MISSGIQKRPPELASSNISEDKAHKSVRIGETKEIGYDPEGDCLSQSREDSFYEEENQKLAECTCKHEENHEHEEMNGKIESEGESARKIAFREREERLSTSQTIKEAKKKLEKFKIAGKICQIHSEEIFKEVADKSQPERPTRENRNEIIEFLNQKLKEHNEKMKAEGAEKIERDIFLKLLEMKADFHSEMGNFLEALQVHQTRVSHGVEPRYTLTSWRTFLRLSKRAKGFVFGNK